MSPRLTASVRALIAERASELGFCATGFARAERLPHAGALRRWLELGRHGEMLWMERNVEMRCDPSVLEPGTRAVIAVGVPYGHDATEPTESTERPGIISRFARGADYHDVARERLRSLGESLARTTGVAVRARPVVDSAPLLERSVAASSGVGWIGKSAMLLSERRGSWFFLAELLVDAELDEPTLPAVDRCGRCTRCIDACPTGAIVAPGEVDARRCISYLNIELRGAMPRELRTGVGDRLFGCDICQEVCPWNRRAPSDGWPEFRPSSGLPPPDAPRLLTLESRPIRSLLGDSALTRAKRRGLARNAAVVLGNTRDPRWSPLLESALLTHDEPLVRAHAAWALGQIADARARAALGAARPREPDSAVLDEIAASCEECGA